MPFRFARIPLVDAPLPEEYSRVTNAGRFAPLHDVALEKLHQLATDFDVRRTEGNVLDPDLERVALARPSIKLTPGHSGAAPITVAFTAFPGLIVRLGRWLVRSFPTCGCDACHETAESEGALLRDMIDSVVGGHFRESISLPLIGFATQSYELTDSANTGQRWSSMAQIPRSGARQLIRESSRSVQWIPWPARTPSSY